MSINPVARYLLLCEDWEIDPVRPYRLNVLGLISNIHSLDTPAFPLLFPELCVLVMLTETRGRGTIHIRCVLEETGSLVFATKDRPLNLGNDPLAVVGVPFRIRNCPFPQSGVYSVQFWYNGEMLVESPLRLR